MGQTFADQERPPVRVCDHPRFSGPCSCDRSHCPGECRNCHRPYLPEVPGFAACRDAWRAQLNQEAA